MSVLNIRGVPEDLTNAVKIAAVKAGIPIREFVIKSLGVAVGVKPAPILSKKSVKAIEKKLRDPERQNEKKARSPFKPKPPKANGEAQSKGPKQEFCVHKLRYCPKCPGFH